MKNDAVNPDAGNEAGKRFDLSASFDRAGLEEWKQEAERLLRGAPFAKKLFTKTLESIEIGPLYTAADTDGLPWRDTLPGQAPYVRGAHAGGYRQAPWLVAQELPLPTAAEFNAAASADLGRGQTALNLVLDRAGRAGGDPDGPNGGAGGTSIATLADLEQALEGISLGRVPLLTQAGAGSLGLAALVLAHLDKQEIRHDGLTGALGFDPAAELARTGGLPAGADAAYAQGATLTKWALDNAPRLKTLVADEAPWHDGGADGALGLALVLAAAVAQLRKMEEHGIEPVEAAARLQFRLCIGSDFFLEIARLRALRLLWHDVLDAAGCADAAAEVNVHARTGRRTQSALDAHVNLLRTTTQAMSAVLGGVDSLHVSPFDEVDSLPDEFSRRIARNQQLILAAECHFGNVADPAGGSYYVESLTAQIAQKAWGVFQEIEAAGGIVAALESGLVQKKVAAAAAARAKLFASRRMIQVGANQYANPQEAVRTVRTPDAALGEGLAAAARKVREADRGEHFQQTVRKLASAAGTKPEDLLPLLAEAALHGATLGELCGWANAGAAAVAIEPVPVRRDAEPFEKLRACTALLAAAKPAAGRVFCACLGDFARYMPRLDFVRRFFSVAGFEVLAGAHFADARSAAKAAADSGAATCVIVGLDDTYAEQAVAAAEALATLDPQPRVYLAGMPGEKEDELKSAGVHGFLHLRSDVLAELGPLVDHLTDEEVAR